MTVVLSVVYVPMTMSKSFAHFIFVAKVSEFGRRQFLQSYGTLSTWKKKQEMNTAQKKSGCVTLQLCEIGYNTKAKMTFLIILIDG